jgi:hypothetical protein
MSPFTSTMRHSRGAHTYVASAFRRTYSYVAQTFRPALFGEIDSRRNIANRRNAIAFGSCPRTAHSGARRKALVTAYASAPERAPVRGHPLRFDSDVATRVRVSAFRQTAQRAQERIEAMRSRPGPVREQPTRVLGEKHWSGLTPPRPSGRPFAATRSASIRTPLLAHKVMAVAAHYTKAEMADVIDPQLDEVRRRCNATREDSYRDQWCGPTGLAELRRIVLELRRTS